MRPSNLGPGRLFWKLFLGNAVLMAAVLAACVWVILIGVNRHQQAELTRQLLLHAETLREQVADRFDREHAAALEAFVKRLPSTGRDRMRVTLILRDGTVLADSDANPAEMERHDTRPEVRQALATGYGQDSRLSATLDLRMSYVAIRVGRTDAPLGVVRVAMEQRSIGQQLAETKKFVGMIALVGIGATIILALGLARLFSTPISRITATARSLSRGDLSAHISVSGNDELSALARSLDRMRSNLSAQLATIDRQRLTLESLLARLHEGVIVVGADGRIVLLNPAAARMLDLPTRQTEQSEGWTGEPVETCITLPVLRRLLLPRQAVSPSESHEGDVDPETALHGVRIELAGTGGVTTLLAHVAAIELPPPAATKDDDTSMYSTGRLVVLTDITELTRMMQMKTDFAANASHELRTPLSAIRAAVETLVQVAAEGDHGDETTMHFLGMIQRQTERMEAMVGDLLDLSRIETRPASFKPSGVRPSSVLIDLRDRHAEALKAKRLHWESQVAADVDMIQANPHLLRLVLDNLVDNAIKFTDVGGRLTIACRSVTHDHDRSVSIAVMDTGCGIPKEEQARVFERFYQVERARTGGIRGTGLGLSIVRHAVAAMHGSVRLESEPGRGTKVTITIPQPEA